jgi:hypothetical protein
VVQKYRGGTVSRFLGCFAKRRVRDREFMTTLKNRELLGLSNARVSERFGCGGGTKVYGRNKSSRFRALYIKARNLLYKRSL